MKDAATTVMERCDLLANISEEPGLIHRPYGSQAMHEANNIVAGWMRMAGMSTRRDQIGNLIGRYEGEGDGTLIFGSHLDTVRDAGRYDSILGVMATLAASSVCTNGTNVCRSRSRWLASPTRKAHASVRPNSAAPCTRASSIRNS